MEIIKETLDEDFLKFKNEKSVKDITKESI